MLWKPFNTNGMIKIIPYTYSYALTIVNHPNLFKKNVMHP